MVEILPVFCCLILIELKDGHKNLSLNHPTLPRSILFKLNYWFHFITLPTLVWGGGGERSEHSLNIQLDMKQTSCKLILKVLLY
jgi:hypothetical protein